MRFAFLSALALGAALTAAGPAAAQSSPTTTLTVNIAGLKNNQGVCKVCLFNKPDGFPNEDAKALRCVEASIKGTASQYVFANLPAGTYAVAVVHDENHNKKLDTNFMGIPKEQYGASRGARGGVGGPPKFAPASFLLSGPVASLLVTME